MKGYALLIAGTVLCIALIGVGLTQCSNCPYRPGEVAEKTRYFWLLAPTTKLDPARAYYDHEALTIDNIYESPFEYHYLKRPYEVVPLTCQEIPRPEYFDAAGNRLDMNTSISLIARVEYTIRLKPGILYQPHPCFARDEAGRPLYRDLKPEDVRDYETPNDFPVKDTRELVAGDYALGVRRLADPRTQSPMLSILERNILGLTELREAYEKNLAEARKTQSGAEGDGEWNETQAPIPMDLMAPEFPGIQVLDRYTFKVVLKRRYPQILYWMAMHSFSPIPQEALDFYDQPALIAKQIVLNRWPVGTGPFYMEEYDPNRRIVLKRNPNYHPDFYPTEGMPGDREAGFLDDAGQRMPFVDRAVFYIEQEAVPRWNKFRQGYFDEEENCTSDVFEQAMAMSARGEADLSPEMQARGVRINTSAGMWIRNFAFNMLDEVVGGYTEEKCKLRQAISIALDSNEYIDIFENGRGVLAQSILPPSVFGAEAGEAGTNPFVNQWDPVRQRHAHKSVEEAKRLLAEAGYPGGRGPDGKPLTIYLDHQMGNNPSFVAQNEWFRRRLEKVGINMVERPTDLSRFRQKVDTGNWQCQRSGWIADYPDPENFLALLYSKNMKVRTLGENVVNYENPEYDRLFEQMEGMENGPERKAIIDRMIRITQHDAPWVWGYFQVNYLMSHAWLKNAKYHDVGKGEVKFRRVDAEQRSKLQREWNRPVVWPVVAVLTAVALVVLPGIVIYDRRRKRGD
jgi:ABC-type oligopeptide transport system substrate-binding subunit